MHEVRAVSLTAVPAHTTCKSSSLLTTCPGRAARSRNTARDLGVIFTICVPHRSCPSTRSTASGPTFPVWSPPIFYLFHPPTGHIFPTCRRRACPLLPEARPKCKQAEPYSGSLGAALLL